jgi:hypothetical protein
MIADLTKAGYLQTREKLADLEGRLAEIEARIDLEPAHRQRVCDSYRQVMLQYKRELKKYEAKHPGEQDSASSRREQ